MLSYQKFQNYKNKQASKGLFDFSKDLVTRAW